MALSPTGIRGDAGIWPEINVLVWEMMAMMFWNGTHWAFWQASLMWLLMLAFWGLLVWAVYALVTAAARKPPRPPDGGGAREILDQRLARGEIDQTEYQRLRDLIGAGDRHAPAGTGNTP